MASGVLGALDEENLRRAFYLPVFGLPLLSLHTEFKWGLPLAALYLFFAGPFERYVLYLVNLIEEGSGDLVDVVRIVSERGTQASLILFGSIAVIGYLGSIVLYVAYGLGNQYIILIAGIQTVLVWRPFAMLIAVIWANDTGKMS